MYISPYCSALSEQFACFLDSVDKLFFFVDVCWNTVAGHGCHHCHHTKIYFCSTQDVPAEPYLLVFFHREMQITVFYYQMPNHDLNNQVNLLLNIRNGWWLDSYEAIH